MKLFFLFFFVIILLFSVNVYSYKLYNGYSNFNYEPNKEYSFVIKVENDKNINYNLELRPITDDLSLKPIINNIVESISPKEFPLAPGEAKNINVKFRIPVINEPGRHQFSIILDQKKVQSSAMISAIAVLGYVVAIDKPYPGKYLTDVKLESIFMDRINKTALNINFKSLGTEKMNNIYAVINIKDENNNLIETINTNSISLDSLTQGSIYTYLDNTKYNGGQYYANFTVYYDGQSKNYNTRFLIGKPFVEILNLSKSNLKPDQINDLDIIIKGKWNQPIKVYADLELYDFFGNKILEVPTASTNTLAWKESKIKAFLQSPSKKGSYKLKVKVHFNNEITEKDFKIEVTDNAIVESPTEVTNNSNNNLLIIGVIVLIAIVVFNVFLFRYIRRKMY